MAIFVFEIFCLFQTSYSLGTKQTKNKQINKTQTV